MALTKIVLKVVDGEVVAETLSGRRLEIAEISPEIKVAGARVSSPSPANKGVSNDKNIKGEPIIQVCPECGGRMTCYEKDYSLRFFSKAMCRKCQDVHRRQTAADTLKKKTPASDGTVWVIVTSSGEHGPYSTHDEALQVAKSLKCACRIVKSQVTVRMETIAEDFEPAEDNGVFA